MSTAIMRCAAGDGSDVVASRDRRSLRGARAVRGSLLVAALHLWTAGALLTVALPRAAHADPAEVEVLIRDGNQLRRDGQPQKALPLFQKAHDLAHTPRTEAQLGLVEMDVGYFVDAEKHLASALEFPNHPFIASNQAALAKALARARTQIGELAIEGEPAGAKVAVNGRRIGALPLATTVRLAAGRAEVEVTAPGYAPFSRSIAVRGAERQQVSVKLEKAASSAEGVGAGGAATTGPTVVPPLSPVASAVPGPLVGPAPTGAGAPAPADEGPSMSGLRVAAWVTGGAAALALGTGVALHLAARSAFSDFDHACYLGTGNQPTPRTTITPMATPESCRGSYDDWNTNKRWSVVGYAAGGALAVTSAILFWRSSSSQPMASSHARLHCAPTIGAVFCRGEF